MGALNYPMTGDVMVGDGGNVTVYQRPDGSRYSLDKKGQGAEWPDGPILGRARFDSRRFASGRWAGSRSTPVRADDPAREPRRARRHGMS